MLCIWVKQLLTVCVCVCLNFLYSSSSFSSPVLNNCALILFGGYFVFYFVILDSHMFVVVCFPYLQYSWSWHIKNISLVDRVFVGVLVKGVRSQQKSELLFFWAHKLWLISKERERVNHRRVEMKYFGDGN